MEHSEVYGYPTRSPRYDLQRRLADFYRCDILTIDKWGFALTRARRPDDGCWLAYVDMQMIDDPRWYESIRS